MILSDPRHPDKKEIKLLRKKFGSPFFMVSENELSVKTEEIKSAFAKYYPNARIYYSLKTNYLPGLLEIFKQNGLFAEVVSGFEYWLAKKIGFKGNEIIFNGPSKADEDIKKALDEGIIIHIDNMAELRRVSKLANGKSAEVGIRLNINLASAFAEAKDFFSKFPNKGWWRFGFSLDENEAYSAAKEIAENHADLDLKSLHIHLGTRITAVEYYAFAAKRILEYIELIEKDFGFNITQVDFGGGFYKTPIDKYIKEIGSLFAPYKDRIRLVIEPGSYLIHEAVSLFSTVTNAEFKAGLQAVTVDVSTSVLFPGYFFSLPAKRADNADEFPDQYKSIIFGNSCVSSDVLSYDATLPRVEENDIIIFPKAGAYTISKGEQFIHPRPPVVIARKNGEIELLRHRESREDLIRLDVARARPK